VGAFGVRDHGATLDLAAPTDGGAEPHSRTTAMPADVNAWLAEPHRAWEGQVVPAPPAVRALFAAAWSAAQRGGVWLLPLVHQTRVTGGVVYASDADEPTRFADETEELRAFLASLGLALGRANAQAAAQRLSEDLAETNRRLQQVQGALLRSRTLAMIAEMASGAGHELNGPLAVISGRAQMLTTRLEDPEVRRALQAISEKAHECSGIVSELMDFARPPAPQLAPLDLHQLLSSVRAEVLQESGLPAARLRFEPPRETTPARVLGDVEQLATVFRELLRNACDAVSENVGTIVLRYQAALEDDAVEVSVEDNGCGMTPAILQRAFDPFYSHRSAGRGRGLGLPRAYRISEAHGGRVWLESHPGEGTTAHVLLRAAAGGAR
jgi:signal transduction histidine kinase